MWILGVLPAGDELYPLFCAFAAAVLSALAIKVSLLSGFAHRVLDAPNERSLHSTPTPRTGGIGIIIAVLIASATFTGLSLWPLLVATLALSAISFCDDIWSLPAIARFGVHFFAALIVVAFYPVEPLWMLVPLVLAIMWMTNLYNFMDGMDGFSGGMAVIGFGAYALVAWERGAFEIGLMASTITGAAIGFMFFNFPPARVFMGDGGAIPLGFLAAALGYSGWREGLWTWWFAPLVFSPFVVDATVTLARRVIRRERVWEAHRSHYYQRMVQAGYGHRGTTMRWCFVMIAVSASAILLQDCSWFVVAPALLGWCAIYAIAMIWIDRLWVRQVSFGPSESAGTPGSSKPH